MDDESALLAVSALHAGFQVVVSVVVYPALADVPPDRWARAHDDHSRRIVLVVAPLYALVVAACVWAVLAGPVTVAVGVAVVGNAVALGTTALVAAPTHGRLGQGRTDALIARLLWSDRVRTLGAVIALAGSCWAVA